MGLGGRAPGLLALYAKLKNVYVVISVAFGEAIGAADPLDVGSGPGGRGLWSELRSLAALELPGCLLTTSGSLHCQAPPLVLFLQQGLADSHGCHSYHPCYFSQSK